MLTRSETRARADPSGCLTKINTPQLSARHHTHICAPPSHPHPHQRAAPYSLLRAAPIFTPAPCPHIHTCDLPPYPHLRVAPTPTPTPARRPHIHTCALPPYPLLRLAPISAPARRPDTHIHTCAPSPYFHTCALLPYPLLRAAPTPTLHTHTHTNIHKKAPLTRTTHITLPGRGESCLT
jgi:hypothetical protein